MRLEEITIDNVKVGAQVVSKQVYEACGIEHCAIGVIDNAALYFSAYEPSYVELEVRWLTGLKDRTFTYKSDSFLMIVPDNGSNILSDRNPNKTFIKKEVL